MAVQTQQSSHEAAVAPVPIARKACFAFGELAWLREEAVAASRRSGPGATRVVHDAHRLEPAFLLAARHPRLLNIVEAMLGGPVVLVATSLHFGANTLAPIAGADLRVSVHLGPAPDLGVVRSEAGELGDVRVLEATDAATLPRDSLHLVLRYARWSGTDARLTAIGDDGLWPPAAFCAG